MAINQLSVFVENKSGALLHTLGPLSDAGVDIRALSLADTSDYGILRLIVADTEQAADILRRSEVLYSVTPVVGIAVEDKPGGMSAVLSLLQKYNVNVEYLYAFVAVSGRTAFLAMRVDDNDMTERILAEHGVRILTQSDIATL